MRYRAIFIWKDKKVCWNTFIKYAHLLTGALVRGDYVNDAWTLVCSLYGIREKDVRGNNEVRHSLFV